MTVAVKGLATDSRSSGRPQEPVSTMNPKEVEKHFNKLSEITDRIALLNSVYDSDLNTAFDEMEAFASAAMAWDLTGLDSLSLRAYLSYMSFHREIVADIIAEARRLLMDDRRAYLKRLVNYHKNFSGWFSRVEKQYAVHR